MGLGDSTNGSGFGVSAYHAHTYSTVTAHTTGVLGFAGWDDEKDPTTRDAALVAWGWARLVAPSVAQQIPDMTCRDVAAAGAEGVFLTTSTPWRCVSGPSSGVMVGVALLQLLLDPGLKIKNRQAVTGCLHLMVAPHVYCKRSRASGRPLSALAGARHALFLAAGATRRSSGRPRRWARRRSWYRTPTRAWCYTTPRSPPRPSQGRLGRTRRVVRFSAARQRPRGPWG
jgi:hypothetical protein